MGGINDDEQEIKADNKWRDEVMIEFNYCFPFKIYPYIDFTLDCTLYIIHYPVVRILYFDSDTLSYTKTTDNVSTIDVGRKINFVLYLTFV